MYKLQRRESVARVVVSRAACIVAHVVTRVVGHVVERVVARVATCVVAHAATRGGLYVMKRFVVGMATLVVVRGVAYVVAQLLEQVILHV